MALAWKRAQARPLAEKAAHELASRLKEKGGVIKDATVDGYRVITVPPITRLQTSFMPTSMFEPSPVVETPIPDVPHAGETFRNAYFGVQAGSAAVAPNQPATVYYVITQDRREPATFSALYAPNGDEYRYKSLASQEAAKHQEQQWINWLRQRAGLKSDWVPPDEAKRDESAQR